MKTFWDLPKAVREKIYRLHLVPEEQPVSFEAYKETCGYTESDNKGYKPAKVLCPILLLVNRKMDREASPIYFGENAFHLARPESLSDWKRFTTTRHMKQMRKVVVSEWTKLRGASADGAFKVFDTLPKLESLTFCFREEDQLREKLGHPDFRAKNRFITWHQTLGFGPQVNLQLLRLQGMDGLRSLRGLREVKLVKDLNVSSDDLDNVGSMPEGFFETVVKQEIMQPRASKKAAPRDHLHGTFHFLGLPAELRNMIYSMLLLFPGPTYPVGDKPLSVTTRLKYMRHTGRDTLPVPLSALEILRVNKQIHNEARKFFYQNSLTFSDPTDMQDFMCSLSDERLECLSSLTLFCEVTAEICPRPNSVTETGLGGTLLLIRRLKGLRKLHLLAKFRKLHHRTVNVASSEEFVDAFDVSRLKDAKTLFTLRGVADIKVLDLDLVDAEEDSDRVMAKKTPGLHARYFQVAKCIARQMAAVRHFNHGLQLAQTGVVVRELYTDEDWRDKESWPVLQGSDCGFHKGCSCGKSGVEEQAAVETSHSSN